MVCSSQCGSIHVSLRPVPLNKKSNLNSFGWDWQATLSIAKGPLSLHVSCLDLQSRQVDQFDYRND